MTTTTDNVKPLTLDEGPLRSALDDIGAAKAAVDRAKANVDHRRQDFVDLFQEILTETDDVAEDTAAAIVGELYWEHDELRVADLTAATGLSSTQLLRLAGPRRAEAPCRRCAAPTEILRTSRSRTPSGLCPTCREYDEQAWVTSVRQDALAYAPFDAPSPAAESSVASADLRRLVDHLERLLSSQQCDNSLTHTRRWARREGLSVRAVVAAVEGRGGFCDCEVVLNVTE